MSQPSKLILPPGIQPLESPEIRKQFNVMAMYEDAVQTCARQKMEIDAQNAIIAELVFRLGGTADIPNQVFEEGCKRGMKAMPMPGALLITLTDMPKEAEETAEGDSNDG